MVRTALTIFVLLVVSSHPCSTAKAQDAADRPNVLFISIDDWNDWLGALGTHPQVQTPNIDRLAERGTLFTNAHVPVP
ncbi:MAG: sulfatase-like hydrolase/transferase, partial [Rhodothermales bacterium]